MLERKGAGGGETNESWAYASFTRHLAFLSFLTFVLGSTYIIIGVIMLGVLTPGGSHKCLFITSFGVGMELMPDSKVFRDPTGYINVSSNLVYDNRLWCQAG